MRAMAAVCAGLATKLSIAMSSCHTARVRATLQASDCPRDNASSPGRVCRSATTGGNELVEQLLGLRRRIKGRRSVLLTRYSPGGSAPSCTLGPASGAAKKSVSRALRDYSPRSRVAERFCWLGASLVPSEAEAESEGAPDSEAAEQARTDEQARVNDARDIERSCFRFLSGGGLGRCWRLAPRRTAEVRSRAANAANETARRGRARGCAHGDARVSSSRATRPMSRRRARSCERAGTRSCPRRGAPRPSLRASRAARVAERASKTDWNEAGRQRGARRRSARGSRPRACQRDARHPSPRGWPPVRCTRAIARPLQDNAARAQPARPLRPTLPPSDGRAASPDGRLVCEDERLRRAPECLAPPVRPQPRPRAALIAGTARRLTRTHCPSVRHNS